MAVTIAAESPLQDEIRETVAELNAYLHALTPPEFCFHMTVEQSGVQLTTRLNQQAPVHYQRPAVDILFHSVARLRGQSTVGLILTGMGADGADGLLAMRQAGAITIAEAEESCVVFGMPKEAIARGAAVHVTTLLKMPGLIFESLERLARPRAS